MWVPHLYLLLHHIAVGTKIYRLSIVAATAREELATPHDAISGRYGQDILCFVVTACLLFTESVYIIVYLHWNIEANHDYFVYREYLGLHVNL